MQVIRKRVIPFDVDNTLILDAAAAENRIQIEFIDPYDGELIVRSVHKPHLKLLKNYIARDAQVIVWSKNGHQWAEAVLEALGLKAAGILVMDKPFAYVDDESSDKWMGDHVFISPDSSFGQESKL